MKSFLVAISVACIFAMFHSSFSLQCYNCFSKNHDNVRCEKIVDDEFLLNFSHAAEHCMRMLVTYKVNNETSDVLLRRSGVLTSALPDLYRELENMRNTNHTVDFSKCQTDKCNIA